MYCGVFERMSPRENIEILKKIKNIKDVYLIGDNSVTYKVLEKIFKQELKNETLNLIYTADKNIEKVKKVLQKSTKNSAGIFIMPASFRDKKGNFVPMKTAMKEIAKSFNRPLLAPADVFSNSQDVIGGYIVSAKAQGEKVAKLILQYLNKKPMVQISHIIKSPNIYVFDMRYLEKFHIKKDITSSYPKTIYLYKKKTFYEKYTLLVIPFYTSLHFFHLSYSYTHHLKPQIT